MSSGLVVGRIIPTPAAHQDPTTHRRLLAEAINHVAAAAYTPETQYQTIEDVDFSQAGADLGFSISVTPFVPARAHVLLILQITNGDNEPGVEVEIPEQIVTDAVPPATDITIPAQTITVPPPTDSTTATIELNENGTPILTHSSDFFPSGGAEYFSVVLQTLRDLEPNTTYIYTVTGTEGAPAKNIIAGANSSMTVRVEHRRLDP